MSDRYSVDDFILVMKKPDFDKMIFDFKKKDEEINNSLSRKLQESVSSSRLRKEETYSYFLEIVGRVLKKSDSRNFVVVEDLEHLSYVIFKTNNIELYQGEKELEAITKYLNDNYGKSDYYLGMCGTRDEIWESKSGDEYLFEDIFDIQISMKFHCYQSKDQLLYKLPKS
jgi:hypothetical protein